MLFQEIFQFHFFFQMILIQNLIHLNFRHQLLNRLKKILRQLQEEQQLFIQLEKHTILF